MRRGGGQNNTQRPQGPGGRHCCSESPPAFSAPPPPPPPFSSAPSVRSQLPPIPPPPPPPVPDYHLYIKPEKVPMESLQYVYDPYGGVPRREDLDPYNTSQPPPRPTHNNDLQPTYRSFRDVILSMQSWGVHYPEPTDTSIKRWARRALRADKRTQALQEQEMARDAPPSEATLSPLHYDSPRAGEEECEEASGDDSTAPPQNVTHTGNITAHFSPITAVQHRTHPPPTS